MEFFMNQRKSLSFIISILLLCNSSFADKQPTQEYLIKHQFDSSAKFDPIPVAIGLLMVYFLCVYD